MRRLLSLPLLLLSLNAFAQQTPPVVKATLDNGMRLLILERHNSPTIAFRIAYAVGAVNDVPGKSGLAHLFEHMAFKGTTTLNSKDFKKEKPLLEALEKAADATIAEETKDHPDEKKLAELRKAQDEAQKAADSYLEKDEYEKLLTENGAEHFNAHTANDYTMYEVSLPSNRLEMWMTMESDRFRNPVLREFYRERQVVMEERRMNYESRPDGKLYENFVTHAYVAHPYHNEGIGWMDDLRKLTAQDAREFFASHYGPSKVVISIIGDVDAKKTLALAKKYFATIPNNPLTDSRVTREPAQEGERRTVVRFQSEPKLLIGYHKPAIMDPDQPVYEMIESLLSSGRTSRFYKNLVEGKQLAQSVDADINWPGQKYPGLVIIDAEPRSPHTPEELEAGIYEELEKLATGPITDQELQKVRNQLESALVEKMESNEGMAEDLAYYEVEAGDWQYPWKLKDALAKVTADDIHRVAAATFKKENRTVATLLPPESAGKMKDER